MVASNSTSKILTPNSGISQFNPGNKLFQTQMSMIQQQQVNKMNKNSFTNVSSFSNLPSSLNQNSNGSHILRIDPMPQMQMSFANQNNFLAPNVTTNLFQRQQQQQQQHAYAGGISSHSSSSTVNNPLSINPNKHYKSFQKFEYNHLLYPTLHEFRWHLKDEIFQLEQIKMKNMRMFSMYIAHIREGNRNHFSFQDFFLNHHIKK